MTKIPTKEECLILLNKNKTPSKVIKHSMAVCKLAESIAEKLITKGIKLNKKLIIAAALLHDIERAKENHVVKGANLLKRMGFREVSEVVKKHSLYKLQQKKQPKTWEEKIVFYADKRVMGNNIVSLKKRFGALEKRYDVDLSKEFAFTKKIEKELLGR
ncbi:HDIG domain-containing protein [Candidatus Woesearchaeota archaeon]|nr:HDIG domain-containing protein [Candidatus Woesearchaeota archaeon]